MRKFFRTALPIAIAPLALPSAAHAFSPAGALRTHRRQPGVALTRTGLAESRSLSPRTFSEAGRERDAERLRLRQVKANVSSPQVIQIAGSDPGIMAQCARHNAELGADAVPDQRTDAPSNTAADERSQHAFEHPQTAEEYSHIDHGRSQAADEGSTIAL